MSCFITGIIWKYRVTLGICDPKLEDELKTEPQADAAIEPKAETMLETAVKMVVESEDENEVTKF